jgi:BMFP domain-containing protein YqiC
VGTAPLAPKKGPPPIPPDSAPDLGTRPVEPMRQRFETSPGMGHGAAAAAPYSPPAPAVSQAAGESPRAPAVQLAREDVESLIRKAVADAVVTVLGETRIIVGVLERRIAELERRPAAAAAAAAPAATYAAPTPVAAQAPVVHVAPAPPLMARTQPLAPVSAIPITYSRPPMLDVKAIERDTSIDVDLALDGSKRKRNIAIIVTILILALFGGLFAMLAQSYAPHH